MNHITQNGLSESSIEKMVKYYRSGQPKKVRELTTSLGVDELVFGLSRSDFLWYLPIDKESKVLDVGCGLGTHVFNMSGFADEVHGIDVSEERIEFCEARKQNEGFNNTHFLLSDVKDLTFTPSTFDAISVHGFTNMTVENLRRLRLLLKPDGMLYFGIDDRMNFKKKYKKMLNDAGFGKKPNLYIASPSYHIPRFIIPVQDTQALKFILNSMTAYRGALGGLVRFFVKIPLLTPLFRNLFHSHAIFVKK